MLLGRFDPQCNYYNNFLFCYTLKFDPINHWKTPGTQGDV
uniref:Uncharacterized protein n=1 Tax=Anguilla anguilla TaxID=7936 RepID=A0A0E9SUF1_ANGAN